MPVKRDPFFPELVKTLGFGACFAAIPIFASMRNLQPPWPEAVAYISAAIILVGALIARELGGQMRQKTRIRLLLLAFALTLVGLFAYLYLYANLVLPLANDQRLILGFTCNADSQMLYSNCPHLREEELGMAEYDPENLFTHGSITAAKLSLIAAWLLFTAGLVAAVGWAVAARKDELPEPPVLTPQAESQP